MGLLAQCACASSQERSVPSWLGEPLTETLGRACLHAPWLRLKPGGIKWFALSHAIISNGARMKVLSPQHPHPELSSAASIPHLPLHGTLSSFLEQMSSCSEESIYFKIMYRHSVNMGCDCFSHGMVMFGLFPQLFLCMPPNVSNWHFRHSMNIFSF